MIITKTVKVYGEDVNIEDLNKTSKMKIEVACDICGTRNIIQYLSYNTSTVNKSEPYYCNKCKNIKSKKTCLDKYGNEIAFKSKEVQARLPFEIELH